MIKRAAVAFFLLASPVFGQGAPLPIVPLVENDLATSTATDASQYVVDYNKVTANPSSASVSDFRAVRGDVQITTNSDVDKADSVSGYLFHDGNGKLEQAYGGSTQYWLRGAGLCNWCRGSMSAARNRGTGRITQAMGQMSVAENARTGSSIGIDTATGIWGMTENYGRVVFGRPGYFVVRNYAGGKYDNAAAAFLSFENEGVIDFAYGLRLDTTNSGTMNNYKAVFIRAPYGTVSGHALYVEWNAPSYFAGDIFAAGSSQGMQAQLNTIKARLAAAGIP